MYEKDLPRYRWVNDKERSVRDPRLLAIKDRVDRCEHRQQCLVLDDDGDILGFWTDGQDPDRLGRAVGADEVVEDGKRGAHLLFYGHDASIRIKAAKRHLEKFPMAFSIYSDDLPTLERIFDYVGFEFRRSGVYVNDQRVGSVEKTSLRSGHLMFERDPKIADDPTYPPTMEPPKMKDTMPSPRRFRDILAALFEDVCGSHPMVVFLEDPSDDSCCVRINLNLGEESVITYEFYRREQPHDHSKLAIMAIARRDDDLIGTELVLQTLWMTSEHMIKVAFDSMMSRTLPAKRLSKKD
jgi:hypothetical protein